LKFVKSLDNEGDPKGPNVQELPVSKATDKMQLALIGGASRVCPVSIPESSLVILGRDGTGANKVRNSTAAVLC
jgi:hypothetical protein